MSLRRLASAALAALVLWAVPASAELPRPFAATVDACNGCRALVIDLSPAWSAQGPDAFDAALERRGFETERLVRPGVREMEFALDAFFARLASEGANHAVLRFRGPLVARDGRAALAGSDTDLIAPAGGRLSAIRLPGLADQLASSRLESVAVILEIVGERPADAPLDFDFPAVAVPKVLLVAVPDGQADALAGAVDAGPLADADAGDAALIAALAERIGPEAEVRLLNPEDAPLPPAAILADGDETRLDGVLDIPGLAAEQRARAYAALGGEADLQALRGFADTYCAGLEQQPVECASAASRIEDIEAHFDQQVLLCHELATHPDDPAATGEGVPDELVALGEALGACRDALDRNPGDPRLMFQYARLLELRRLPGYVERYEEAIAEGYAVAAYALAFAILERRVPGRGIAETVPLARQAADAGVVPAMRLYARLLIFGYGSGDRAEARRYLERAARTSPVALVDLAELILSDAGLIDAQRKPLPVEAIREEQEPAAREADRLLSDALHRGLVEDIAVEVRARREWLKASLEALEEPDPEEMLAECRRRLDFDPLELFGLFDYVQLHKNIWDELSRIQRRKLRRLDIEAVLAACNPVVAGPGVSSEIKTRYAALVEALQGPAMRGLDYGKAGTEPDALAREAAERGDPVAMFLHGVALRKRDPASHPYAFREGQDWLQRAHQRGVAEASFFLAIPHLQRDVDDPGFRPDPALALDYLLSIRDRPIPAVKIMLATILSDPAKFGIRRPPATAREIQRLLKEAEELGVELP